MKTVSTLLLTAALAVFLCLPSAFAQDDDTPNTPTMCALQAGEQCAAERCMDSPDPAICGVQCAVSARINCGVLVNPLALHETPISDLTIVDLDRGHDMWCIGSWLRSEKGIAVAEVLGCVESSPEPPDCNGPVVGPGPVECSE